MKILFESSLKKGYIELTPTISIGWFGQKIIYIGWLIISIAIIF